MYPIDFKHSQLIMATNHIIFQAAEAIAGADTLLITAGAGIGVDSGLPDFRGNQGFWNLHPAYAKQRMTFADLANPIWFECHPERAWGFYGHRYHLYQQTTPHLGFTLLQKWLSRVPRQGFVYTSNVDGQFQKAGFPIDQLYECHGSIHYLQCVGNCHGRIWPIGNLSIEIDHSQFLATGELPSCPDCGRIARPNILMFGDNYWLTSRADLQRQVFQEWKERNLNSRLTIIEIGAGWSVGGVRSLGQNLSGTLIRINPHDPEGPAGTISIAMPALSALSAIDQALTGIGFL